MVTPEGRIANGACTGMPQTALVVGHFHSRLYETESEGWKTKQSWFAAQYE